MPAVTPQAWADELSAPPILQSGVVGRRAGLLRRWRGTEAHMSQPPLDHHYVVLHLGGPKRVTRSGEGAPVIADVVEGAITIVPAGTRYEWRTEGPIDFAHLYIHPARANHAVASLIDRDPARTAICDRVGALDPLMSEAVKAMLVEAQRGEAASRPYLELLFDTVLAALVRNHASGGEATVSRHALAPVRLRRVLDHLETALADPLDLAGLAAVAGLSRFHFSRAFHRATGEPPLAYVARRRIELAKRLLRETDAPLREVARRTGYASPSHFAERFRSSTGMTPSDYRRRL